MLVGFICCNLTCVLYRTGSDSFSDSISFNQGTFPSHQQTACVITISTSSDYFESVSMEVAEQFFCDSKQFKDALWDYAIKWNFNFIFTKNDK